jgi:hypothetical protein
VAARAGIDLDRMRDFGPKFLNKIITPITLVVLLAFLAEIWVPQNRDQVCWQNRCKDIYKFYSLLW